MNFSSSPLKACLLAISFLAAVSLFSIPVFAPDLTVDGSTITVAGLVSYDNVILKNGGVINVDRNATFIVKNDFFVCSTCLINATARGALGGTTSTAPAGAVTITSAVICTAPTNCPTGGGGGGLSSGGVGGSSGGSGGSSFGGGGGANTRTDCYNAVAGGSNFGGGGGGIGDGTIGASIGGGNFGGGGAGAGGFITTTSDCSGSGNNAGNGTGGAAAGLIKILAQNVTIFGSLEANGGQGKDTTANRSGSGGGGSAGIIQVNAYFFNLTGNLTANGGPGGNNSFSAEGSFKGSGGGGSGGLIDINTVFADFTGRMSANGGQGGNAVSGTGARHVGGGGGAGGVVVLRYTFAKNVINATVLSGQGGAASGATFNRGGDGGQEGTQQIFKDSQSYRPTILTLQGKLTDSAGANVNTASFRVTIREITPTGTIVWGPFTFNDVVSSGKFNVLLGARDRLDLVQGFRYALTLEIDAGATSYSTADVTFGDASAGGDLIVFTP